MLHLVQEKTVINKAGIPYLLKVKEGIGMVALEIHSKNISVKKHLAEVTCFWDTSVSKRCHIILIETFGSYRRNGLARLLMSEVIEKCKNEGIRIITGKITNVNYEENEPGALENFYIKTFGFSWVEVNRGDIKATIKKSDL